MNEANSTKPRDRIDTLTSLRFFAALAILITHIEDAWLPFSSDAFGAIGVVFFFVLSGFILSYNYCQSFSDRIGLSDLRDFYISRCARIYPVYFLTLVLSILLLNYGLGKIEIGTFSKAIFINLLLIQSWAPNAINFNTVSWTISDESFFYALTPPLLFLISKLFGSHKRASFLIAAFGLWALQAIFLMTHSAFAEHRYTGYQFPPNRFVDFTIGALLGTAHYRFAKSSDLVDRKKFETLESVAVFAFSAMLAALTIVPAPLLYSNAMLPALSIIIAVFAYQKGRFSKYLSSPRMVYLGEVSFSLYMVHFTIFFSLRHYVYFLAPAIQAVLGVALSMGSAMLIFEYIEKPARQKILQLRHTKRAPTGLEVATAIQK